MNKTETLLNTYNNSDNKLKEYITSLWVDLWENYDIHLLKRAFTHKSFSNDVHKKIESNERLEFLWDAILWFIIADMLYHEKIPMWEDMMSLYKIALVNEKILAEVAREINAWDYIFLGLWELNSDGKNKDSVLSDFIEALIAYIYIDLWEQQAREFIEKYIYSKFEKIRESWNVKSPKSLLQEFLQNKHKLIPKYVDYEEEVDEKWNVTKYRSEVYLEDKLLAEGFWPNKKKAQTDAAEKAFEKLNKG
jgi:ribonuclease-3